MNSGRHEADALFEAKENEARRRRGGAPVRVFSTAEIKVRSVSCYYPNG